MKVITLQMKNPRYRPRTIVGATFQILSTVAGSAGWVVITSTIRTRAKLDYPFARKQYDARTLCHIMTRDTTLAQLLLHESPTWFVVADRLEEVNEKFADLASLLRDPETTFL